MIDLKNWKPRPLPEKLMLDGRFVRLEPLTVSAHGDELFSASYTTGR